MIKALSQILPITNESNTKSSKVKSVSPEYFYNALLNGATLKIGNFESETLVVNVGVMPIKERNEDIKIISLFPAESKNHLTDLLRVLGK